MITDMSQLPKVLAVRDRLPHLKTVIVIGAGAAQRLPRLGPLAGRGLRQLRHRSTPPAEDPALADLHLGTTGQPQKARCSPIACLLGSIPACASSGSSRWPRWKTRVMWTPADWAWIAGLYDALFPAWFLRHAGGGAPLPEVRSRARLRSDFPPGNRVGVAFVPTDRAQDDAPGPKAARAVGTTDLRAIATGGEAMGGEPVRVGPRHLRHHSFPRATGQTGMQSDDRRIAPAWFAARPGSCGRPARGRVGVAIVDNDGNVLPPTGEEG